MKRKRPIRALVVDDNEDAAKSLSLLLQATGCGATFVTDPLVAIDAAQVIEADVVFLDLGMPTLNGYELARMFRKRYGEGLLRLVAVSGYGSPEHRVLSRESGFDAHVQKPVDIDIVKSMLATLFAENGG